mgnify:CR=1 FL=1
MNALYWVCLVAVLVLVTFSMASRGRSERAETVSVVAALAVGVLAVLLLICGVR